ncbi:MAG: acetyl-CoA carboxylase carboxyltransferase subunit alpha [Lachnospiraceae bacterium]|nr:acetyl-CoA carboxylase carboxyltransferase subunit alpha [Lachnospiraceae bacterium]
MTGLNLAHRFKKTTDLPNRADEGNAGDKNQAPAVPDGLLSRCNKCRKSIYTAQVKEAGYICPHCGGYFRMPVRKRIALLTEPDGFEEWDIGMAVENPLNYKGYPEKVQMLREKYDLDEAVLTGLAQIGSQKAALAVMDGRFLMGSMGHIVGEKITRAVERATRMKLPVIILSCSGGARMQEGMTSLMQMAKTSAALKRHSDAGLLYISVLTDPTMGGVTASFAMLGDVILAEPKALIGFAGPRVIEQTIGQKLPKGFQKAEFLLEHGFLDGIVPRMEMKNELERLLKLHENLAEGQRAFHVKPIQKSKREQKEALLAGEGSPETEETPAAQKKITSTLTPWERVQISRKKDRPVGRDYLNKLFTGFMELHGDRCGGDDPALTGGIALFRGCPVTVLVQKKGKSTTENVDCRFGMMSPEGYRKALRLMKEAEKFHRPVICLVDTPGAFCGMEAEERGQGEAIARNLFELSGLKVPVLSLNIGEGGSGGALALALADEVWMLENSVYSVLSPEGYAAILWKDASLAEEAANLMKMTAPQLKAAGVVERVFAEPKQYTTDTMETVCRQIRQEIGRFLAEKSDMTEKELLEQRYERYRKF